ncbi:MFS transporter [Streptomyces jumonjinensis]|uniref:MFS transporter n=1 Tax=Streptomyces jumonjinensis TaxID=1945 RepID=UPI00379CC4ED
MTPGAVSRPRGYGSTAYVWGESASLAGSAVSAVALPALAILHLHATPAQAAALALPAHLPAFALALPAGVLADRRPRKRLMILSDLAAATAVASVPASAAALDALTVPVLYAVTLLTGAAGVRHQAAAIALVPQLSTPDQLHRANSRIGAAFAAADSASTYAGTALISAVGATRSLLVDALSYLAGTWCATRIRPGPSTPPDEVRARPQALPLAGGEFTVPMRALTPARWQALLAEHGLVTDAADVLAAPDGDDPLSSPLGSPTGSYTSTCAAWTPNPSGRATPWPGCCTLSAWPTTPYPVNWRTGRGCSTPSPRPVACSPSSTTPPTRSRYAPCSPAP